MKLKFNYNYNKIYEVSEKPFSVNSNKTSNNNIDDKKKQHPVVSHAINVAVSKKVNEVHPHEVTNHNIQKVNPDYLVNVNQDIDT